ncbi:DUF3887 domain-containing protein [Mycolicibacterium fluoranthenivorans]|uniref:DUF3887 domain-containing protein n=1 Tax=Mycolicibacterium fluoranthenivorans TaxID=258505 RepID=A0A7G8PLK7_9MYCO|nr:DUF3887 domain-containing protein [Mycolicibacterium fluoranthenivorans]QNJ95223.1 DUF3887 domain-containing protein [Mycolicibacterium fluoranthenivorans]
MPLSRQRLVAAVLTLLAGAGITAPPAMAADTPDQVALATLDEIVRGDYPAAAAEFNPTMQKLLPAKALQESWDIYQKTFGVFQSHGDPEAIPRDNLTIVNVPLQMAQRPGQFRLAVQPDGTISSLKFLKEGVPVP